jgi:hypothetical protein
MFQKLQVRISRRVQWLCHGWTIKIHNLSRTDGNNLYVQNSDLKYNKHCYTVLGSSPDISENCHFSKKLNFMTEFFV